MKMIYNNSAELLVGSRQLLNNYTTIYTDIQLHNNIYRYTTTQQYIQVYNYTTIYTDIQLQQQYIQMYNYNVQYTQIDKGLEG